MGRPLGMSEQVYQNYRICNLLDDDDKNGIGWW